MSKDSTDKKTNELDNQNYSLIKEFWEFLKHSKRWWLLPIVIIMALLSVFILFTSSSPVFPMIYAMF